MDTQTKHDSLKQTQKQFHHILGSLKDDKERAQLIRKYLFFIQHEATLCTR